MRLRPALLVALAAGAGCATAAPSERGDVIRMVVPSTVQLRAEREGGVRRSGSGVVLASDVGQRRSWVVTTRHFLDPPGPQEISLSAPGRAGRVKITAFVVSDDADVAVLTVDGVALPAATLRDEARVGDGVWVIGFPWGRRLTVVSGVVSQVTGDEGQLAFEGPARMVDASVSYGVSGAGVFDVATGALLGIVEGYRTARITLQASPERIVDIPVPGETTVIASPVIRRFMRAQGLELLLAR